MCRLRATQLRTQAAGKPFDPIWIFHGSDPKNVAAIMEEGFRVGGKDYPPASHWKGGKFPVANGTAHGQGVYSATGPNTPMGYSGSQSSEGKIILVTSQVFPFVVKRQLVHICSV